MNKNLDFLRAFAVSLVVLNHLIEFFGGPASIGPMDINCIGRMGVLLFFVHTSLVLMQSLERDPIRSKFYMRRAFRIYPLAMATIATAVVFNIPGAHLQTHQFLNYPADKMDIFANMLLVQDFSTRITLVSPSWTLLYELLMYLCLPFLFSYAYTKNKVITCWLCAIALSIGLRSINIVNTTPVLHTFLYFLPCFMPGVLAYQLLKDKQFKLPAWCWPLAVIIVCFMFTMMIHADYAVYSFSALVGMLIPRFEEISSPVLTKVSHYIAKYSYGIYLSNFAIIYLAFQYGSRFTFHAQVMLFIIGSITIPLFMYHLIEEPMIQIGKQLTA